MAALLSIDSATKSYNGVIAVDGISFDVPAGSVLALVGENGAGKSTVINLVSAVVSADHGTISFDGKPLPHSPRAALAGGVATVHQELTLFPHLSVWENIWVNHELRHGARLDRRRMVAETVELLDELGASISPTARVGSLSLAQQTQVEIAKALSWSPRLLILDEATSALGAADVDAIFATVGRLTGAGASVLFVSHRLAEVLRFSDAVLALRDGRVVGRFDDASTLDEASLVTTMIGRPISAVFPSKAVQFGEAILDVQALSGRRVRDVSLTARAGEIVGLGGLQGHGQQELLQLMFGASPRRAGRVTVGGHGIERITPRRMVRRGVAYIPADRKSEGLLLAHSVEMNLTLTLLDVLGRRRAGFLAPGLEARTVNRIRDYMQVVQRAWRQTVGSLSGGNQQKVLIGRWLERNPQVLLLDEPTRGVDIGTKAEIYRLLREQTEAGRTVLIASTENVELLGLCDRIVVLYDGAIVRELTGDDIDEYHLTSATLGVASATSEAA